MTSSDESADRLVVDLGTEGPRVPLVVSVDGGDRAGAPPSSSGPRVPARRRRRLVAAILALSALVLAAAGWWVWNQGPLGPSGDERDDPAQVVLPEVEQADDTVAYLKTVGAPLMEVVDAVAPMLAADEDSDRRLICRRLATEELPGHGEPATLVLLATAVPDAATGDMLLGHLAALMAVVASCGEEVGPDHLDELDFHHVVVQRRFDDLGLA